MNKKLNILILEDVSADAELMERELHKENLSFITRYVETRTDFIQALENFKPDIILSDYNLPTFSGMDALMIAKKKCPDVPFLFVTGALGEELCIETLKRGATDFVLKTKLMRLGPVVRRALREAEEQAERREADRRQSFAVRVLEHLNQSDTKVDTIEEILHLIKEFTQVEAAAIRLRENEDFPYYASNGFSEEFVSQERDLCKRDDKGYIVRDQDDKPCLECHCGRVLSRQSDSKLPFYTDKGSYWVNSAAEMHLSSVEQGRQDNLRNKCMEEGYESVALIPLKSNGDIFGLLQLNDRRQGMFSTSFMHFFEGIGASIGVALARQRGEDRLRQSEEKYRLLAENAKVGIYIHSDKGFEYLNPALETIFGCTAEEITGSSMDSLDLIHPEDRERVKKERTARIGKKYKPSRFSFRIICRDGNIKHVEVNTIALPSENFRVLGILRDISERVSAENEMRENMLQMENMMYGTVQALAMVTEIRDPYTAGHQNRVARLALALAEQMGLEEDKIDGIRMAGLVHDIGKIQIPAEILSKPGRLTDSEFNLIKAHPQVGYDILKTIEFPYPMAMTVYQHHERMDGSGYPKGLKDDEILLEARILAVADVVEAMTSHRPYRPALGIDKAMEEIVQNREIYYDSNVVEACLQLFRAKKSLWGQPVRTLLGNKTNNRRRAKSGKNMISRSPVRPNERKDSFLKNTFHPFPFQ